MIKIIPNLSELADMDRTRFKNIWKYVKRDLFVDELRYNWKTVR